LYEIGDFNLNAAQVVSNHRFTSYINSRVKNSTNVLTVIKILSLAGLIVSVFLPLKLRFGMPTGKCLGFFVT
jgi:hypothetical protein